MKTVLKRQKRVNLPKSQTFVASGPFVPIETFDRLLEDGDTRITEDGDIRTLE
jgi:hypothetical protein